MEVFFFEQYLDKLKCITLKDCNKLVRTPEFRGVPRLKRISLSGCINLVEIHPSIGQLSELEVLDLSSCVRLQSLPKFPSTLRDINLSGCMNLVEIHPSIGQLSELEVLDLHGCGRLQSLPKLPSTVRDIKLSFCMNLVEIHPSIGQLSELEVLDLRGCGRLQSLPKFPSTPKLEVLDLCGCGRLQSLPKFPSTLRYINAKCCKSLVPSPTMLKMGIWSHAGSLQSLPKFPSTSPTMLEIGIWSDPGSQLYRCGENNCGVGFTILTRYLQVICSLSFSLDLLNGVSFLFLGTGTP